MAYISELHYSNAYAGASGVSEFLEVTLNPGEDPADFTVSFYQHTGAVGIEINLADPGVIATFDPATGKTFYVISEDNFPIQLTDPNGGGASNYEAYALTDIGADPDDVLNFFDIGGGTTNITAVNGLAAGVTSTNIVVPTGPGAATYSIQFKEGNPDPIFLPVTPGGPVCFCRGTRIAALVGSMNVEDLREGDLIPNVEGDFRVLQKILRQEFGVRALCDSPALRPVRITAGALGNGLPERDLLVSRQHRMVVSSKIANRMFETHEVLVPAILLTELPGIYVDETVEAVEYFHLVFDQHEVIRAEGAPTESLYPGPEALRSLSPEAREEIQAIFPEITCPEHVPVSARLIPARLRQKRLVARHRKNSMPLFRATSSP
ncbi:Hint domain-containing protein [Ruegeria sp. HKCCD8929]|uniref:Hint domain-containing protein n=1 Tax=Ruegeria sp. HKCCD8929 TaxID=2683006 RepID=UPI0014886C60|nr:Hint domain-containing protein [Ruegeria sp. HKCCD8929]